MHMLIDELRFETKRKGTDSYVDVLDLKNKNNRASLLINEAGVVTVLQNTFSEKGRRMWQVLYFAELNKQRLHRVC